MFLPKSIQINMVLGTSVLSATSSEVSTKTRTRNDFHWFPHLSCSLWLFEGCWSLRRARHWVISPPSRFVDWWLPGMRTLSSAKLVVSSGYDARWISDTEQDSRNVLILPCAQSASECEDYKFIQGYTWIGVKWSCTDGDRMGEGYRPQSFLIFNVSNTNSVFLPGNQPQQKVLECHSHPKMLSCKSPSTKLKMVCLKSSPQWWVQNKNCETSKYLNCLAGSVFSWGREDSLTKNITQGMRLSMSLEL